MTELTLDWEFERVMIIDVSRSAAVAKLPYPYGTKDSLPAAYRFFLAFLKAGSVPKPKCHSQTCRVEDCRLHYA